MTAPSRPTVAAHSDCAAVMVRYMAEQGCEVTASDKRPGMVMPDGLEEFAMRCPHGVVMWMEPTPEQRLRWIADGTR